MLVNMDTSVQMFFQAPAETILWLHEWHYSAKGAYESQCMLKAKFTKKDMAAALSTAVG